YQATVLAQLTDEVYAIERLEPLIVRARLNLRAVQEFRVRLKHGDGQLGLPEAAPFDTIILAAAARAVPPALLSQLAVGGRMLLPLGSGEQVLCLIERRPEGFVESRLDAVRFVPLLSGIE
ncbi:MAG: protein-L-isoaspartate O-methyltransferase, partial [Azospira sp.]|nr:protein-L-isoaspartate O-methyltransferase [Azospira sp.]